MEESLLVKVLLTLNGLFYRAAPRLRERVERLGAEFAFLDSNRLTRQDLLTHIKDVHIYIAGVEKADREPDRRRSGTPVYHEIRRGNRQY